MAAERSAGKDGRRKAMARRAAVSAAGAALLVGLPWLFAGTPAAAAGAALALLWVAWRHDNQLGACFPLAVLLLIVVGVMLMLFFMLIVVRPH